MLAAMASFIGKFALKEALQGVLAGQLEQAIAQKVAGELMEGLEEKAARKPRILGVESETWYAFRMEQEKYWTQANRFLANQMDMRVRMAYSDVVQRASAPPFALTANPTDDGFVLNFRKSPRSAGYDRNLCRSAAITAVRKSMRAYVRMAASGIPIEG